jgi:gas vesicle protein
MKVKREKSPPQAVAANAGIKQDIYELAHEELSMQAETDKEIALLVKKVGATSIEEIERLMAELQETRSYLQSEGERIEREVARYTNLTQTASVTTKIIFDAVSQLHPSRNQQKTNASELPTASTEDNIGAFRKSHDSQQDAPELGQAADATQGT